MSVPRVAIRIIGTDECPLYHVGDEFSLNGNTLNVPPGKSTCLVLAQDILTVTVKHECHEQGATRYVFDCSGCTGLARLEFVCLPEGARPAGGTGIREAVERLGDHELFRVFGEEGMARFRSLADLRTFDKGAVIVEKGTAGHHLYIIVEGRVEVLSENDIRMAVLGKGEVFGEISLISDVPTTATVRAMTPLSLLHLGERGFKNLLHESPGLQTYLTRMLARRIARTNVVRSREIASGLSGNLSEISPMELFQALHANQKTGVLMLKLPDGLAAASFREGRLIRAKFRDKTDLAALDGMLRVTEGRYKFNPGLPEEETRTEPVGNLLKMLMEAGKS